ncbi:hypothetical protein [Acidovorax sp. A1169]|uniref:hypothetical protein n=1 Tax=Acidovorax sp. A1169 TaxID=3059524 RepID=UPI0027379DE6|nr:hypothetical protein [Acidovorax sp. A1169]
MSIRPILAAFLLLVPLISPASEGMIYGSLYECNAEEINRDMVEICSGQFPDLSLQANDAISVWRDRNLAKANAAKARCSRDLSEKSKNASWDDLQALRTLIANTKTEMLSGFRAKMRKEGVASCLDALKQLKTPGGALDIH